MIYSASLNVPVKKALGKKVMQSNINKICELMGLDPDTTNMDVVILGPKDFVGPKATKVQKCIDTKHPDVCVIYLYEKAAEADIVNCLYKRQCKKIKTTDITEAFEEFVGQSKLHQGKQQVSSADFSVLEDDSLGGMSMPKNINDDLEMPGDDEFPPVNKVMPNIEPVEEVKEVTPEPELPELDLEPVKDAVQPLESTPLQANVPTPNPLQDTTTPVPEVKPVGTVEDYLAGLSSYEDWGIMKEHLQHDSVYKNLISENSEFKGLVNMLDVLDKQIEAVWRDASLSADQKFERIKDIGLERSVVRAKTNSIQVEKVISIISTIILSAKRTVDEKVSSLDASLCKIATDKESIMDTSYIDKAITERTKIQLELLNIGRGIVDLYKSIDTFVTDEISELDRKLPSSNQFINEMVKPIGTQIFTPVNTADLANMLLRALQENRIVMSQLEESVNALINTLFDLCEKDEEIIRYQQHLINLLKANRVEDVVITDTLLKKILKLYVGADNTGRSATAITKAGIMSRSHNSLLIDLTGRAKFREYGITPLPLSDFLHSRVEEPFLCVESKGILSPDELQELVTVLKSRLNYYPYVNVILAPEDTNGLQQLAEEANSIYYITNCSTASISTMKDVIATKITENIAKHLVTIDTPVSPLMIADSLNIDATSCKLDTLPNIQAMRACSLKHDRPYEYSDIIRTFEEAFK